MKPMIKGLGLYCGPAAEPLLDEAAIAALTAAAVSSHQIEGLTPEQLAEHDALPRRAFAACAAAVHASNRFIAVARNSGELAGYVIAARHGPDDHELDWLMVDPAWHGSGIADVLMLSGMTWLGLHRPMWLSVANHNVRAIRFYRRFGFAMDAYARTAHAVPHRLMRRLPY